jgi:hypothetical protein
MATLGALIERNIWLIYTPQAAAFVVTAMVAVWGIVLLKAGKHRRPPDTNELVVMLTALYVSVAYLILYPTVATARTQALLRIYELLPVQDPAKALLFSPQENAGTVRNDPTKGAALYDLAVRLDRAATVAYQIGAVSSLLERYWDWYVLLLGKYDTFLTEYRHRQATEFLQNLGNGGVALDSALTPQEEGALWFSHLQQMRPELRRYLKARVPALADRWAAQG